MVKAAWAWAFVWTVASFAGCPEVISGKLSPRDARKSPLSDFVASPRPWLNIEGDSEQATPLYLGNLPREIALGKKPKARPEVAEKLRALGEAQARRIAKLLGEKSVELEAWPMSHWKGYLTWAFARYRRGPEDAWKWLDSSLWKSQTETKADPVLPVAYQPWKEGEDQAAVFKDFLELDDLYSKPDFGHCVWTDESGDNITGAWLPPASKHERAAFLVEKRLTARAIHQPAWFNDKPITFTIKVDGGKAVFPETIEWVPEKSVQATPKKSRPRVKAWADDYDQVYQADVETIAGERDAVFPLSGKSIRFVRKSSAQPNHDLEKMVDYLEERYRKLGIVTVRQRFLWRGIPQSNLIAIIPGSLQGNKNKPVLMADHMDTAFCENVFDEHGERVSTAGADDNSTAVAALLRAGEILRDSRPKHDIWLVHITGEEFPSDGLGTRHFLSEMLKRGQDFSGLVLMDMIGWRRKNDRVFQVNAGESAESVALAEVALGAAADLAPELKAVFRSRFDERSYLYNTDGIVFSQMGYPVILLNEHLNGVNMRHPHYHQSSDVSGNVDFTFAAAISRVAIETALRLAKQGVQPRHRERSEATP